MRCKFASAVSRPSLTATFCEGASRASRLFASLKLIFERTVMNTEFMDHKLIKCLINGFAHYAHQ